jgi:hypothetical protein
MATIVGFLGGAPPENPDTWEKRVYDERFTLKKSFEKGLFTYSCKHELENDYFEGSCQTGFVSPQELTREEVERRPQFVKFMAQWNAPLD